MHLPLVLGALLLGSPESPRVIPAETALAQLTQAGAPPVELSAKLKGHRVLVDRGGSTASETLEAVARCLSATLLRTESGYRIERTAKDEREIAARLASDRLRWLKASIEANDRFCEERVRNGDIQAALEREIGRVKDRLEEGPGSASLANVAPLLPANRLLQEIVQRIGLEALAALPSGSVTVYEQPAVAARSLPRVDDLLDAYRKRQDSLDGARLYDEWDRQILGKSPTNPFANWSVAEGYSGKLRIEVRVVPSGLSFQLEGYDRRGKRTLFAYFSSREDVWFVQPAEVTAQERAKVGAPMVTLAPGAIEAFDFLGDSQASTPPEWFKRPDRQEPLDRMVRDVLLALAGPRDRRCLAMDVPDGLLGAVRTATTQDKVNLSVLKRRLRTSLPYERVDGAKAVVWRPRDPLATERSRADRTALRRFVDRTLSQSAIEIRDRAKLFYETSPARSAIALDWSFRTASLVARSPSNDSLWDGLYRFLGAIPDVQWSRLMRGEGFTAKALGLTPRLQTLLNEEQNLPLLGPSDMPDLYQHPLETFDRTSVGDATIRFEVADVPVEIAWTSDQTEPTAGAGPRDGLVNSTMSIPYFYRLGEYRTTATREAYEAMMDKFRIRYGVRSDCRVIVGLPHGCAVVAEFQGVPRMEAKVVRYSELPAALRDAGWAKANASGIDSAKRIRQSMSPDP